MNKLKLVYKIGARVAIWKNDGSETTPPLVSRFLRGIQNLKMPLVPYTSQAVALMIRCAVSSPVIEFRLLDLDAIQAFPLTLEEIWVCRRKRSLACGGYSWGRQM